MKLEIDTKEDSHEAIRAAIQVLQAHLQNEGATNITTNFSQSQSLYSESTSNSNNYSPPGASPSSNSYEDRLAKKIAKAKEREESYASTPVAMSMFDAPITNPVKENIDSDDDEESYDILTY